MVISIKEEREHLAERKQKKEELYFEIRQLERKGCNLRKEFEKTKMIKNCTVNY